MFKLVVLFALLAVAASKPSGLGYSALVAAPVAVPAAVSHTYRKDVVSEPVVAAYAAPAIHAYATPAVVAAPIVQKTVIAAAPVAVPAAVSHSYRSDVISKPVVAAYAAPVVSYAAHGPALAYAAHVPAVHAW